MSNSVVTDSNIIERRLLQCAADKKLFQIIVSDDGSTLKMPDGMILSATAKIRAELEGKSCEYSSASIVLQIVEPDQGLLAYRNLCKKYYVVDPVKALDKRIVVSYFLGTPIEAPPSTTEAPTAIDELKKTDNETNERKDISDGKEQRTEQQETKDRDQDKERHSKDKRSHRDDKKFESSSDRLKRKERERLHQHKQQHQQNRSSSTSPNKRHKTKKDYTVTNEQLIEHLDVVVDKRKIDPNQLTSEEGGIGGKKLDLDKEEAASLKSQQEEIRKALSAEGFHLFVVSSKGPSENSEEKDSKIKKVLILPEHKERTAYILANETPVGSSASILRCNNPRKDLSRVLELYMETMAVPLKKGTVGSKSHPIGGQLGTTGSSSKGVARKTYLIGKRPVIVVPKGMTAPITILNAYEFLANAKFIPRDIIMKQQSGKQKVIAPTTFTRQVQGTGDVAGGSHVNASTCSGLLEYEITDNPRKLLGPDPKEWERIVAVIVLGQSWQFKDWHKLYSSPATLFDNVVGFYISMEGDREPAEVGGWSVTRSFLNRDKRGLDRVTYASFWNRLDEWMRVYKSELLSQTEQSN